MKVRDVMTEDVACCTPESNLQEVARLMVERDCGAIPVVEGGQGRRPVGVVTDRDITTRAVAQGKDPRQMTARDVMSTECCTVGADASLKDCCAEMESHQVRRLIVTDEDGACCGIVAQADIALNASKARTGEVLREVSQPAATTG